MRRSDLLVKFLALSLAGCASEPPPEAAAAEPLLVVSQKASKSIGWYKLDGELVAEAAVSDHPHEIVLSPDKKRLYVADNGVMQIEYEGEGGNKVSIIDVDAKEKVGEVDLGEYRRPHGIDLCANGVLLVTSELPDQLLVIDLEQRAVVRTFDTGGETPHIVHCSQDSTQAYASNSRSGTVARIDIETGERELLETGARPEGSCFSPDHASLYVTHRDGNKIVAIDTADWSVTGEFSVPGQPVRCGVGSDGRTIAYGLFNGAAVGFADLRTMQEVGRVATAGPTTSLEMSEDGQTALACAQDEDVCYLFSMAERSITKTVHVKPGSGPDPLLLIEP
jgi:DNA-binding beta-propeller fold protein YncE